MLRPLLFSLTLFGGIVLGLQSQVFLSSADASFRMPEIDAPVQNGRVQVDARPDLFVPVTGPFDYAVPADLSHKTRSYVTDGRRWHLYMPQTGERPVATLLLFHGAGRGGLSMIDMWRGVADEQHLRLVALDGRSSNWPQQTVKPAILHRILNEIRDPLSSDREPVYLFGHSNGGAYVQRLINEADGPWRAAAIHAGFADPAGSITPAEPKPIRYYVGTREHIFKPESARFVARELATRGHAVDLQIIPQHTHWFYAGGPRIASDAWHWLSRQ